MEIVRVKYVVLVIFMASIVLSGMAAFAAPPENFTATMVSQGMEMPMARMGSKSRVENPGMKGVVTIALGDAKKTIMMNTTTKTYHEQSTQDREQMPTMYDSDIIFDKKRWEMRRLMVIHASNMILFITGRANLTKSIRQRSGRPRT
jgi:hypothetical protein